MSSNRYQRPPIHGPTRPRGFSITGAQITQVDVGPAGSARSPGADGDAKGGVYPLVGYTAASEGLASTHKETGWMVAVHLDRQGRSAHGEGSRWRSGESLRGWVELTAPAEPPGGQDQTRGPQPRPCSVICRAFCQSTTLYFIAKVTTADYGPNGRLGRLKPAALSTAVKTETSCQVEWNRAFLRGGGEGVELWQDGELEEVIREVDRDFAAFHHAGGEGEGEVDGALATATLGPLDSRDVPLSSREPGSESPPPPAEARMGQQVFPFEFLLPTAMRVAEANPLRHPPPDRHALHHFRRTPPPSLPALEGLTGCVEWTVECLVRFPEPDQTASPLATANPSLARVRSGASNAPQEPLPTFHDPTPSTTASLSQFGLLSATPTLLVHRANFPFEPADTHAQDLYSAWRPDVTGAWAEAVARYNNIPLHEIQDLTPVPSGSIVPAFGRDPRNEALGGSNMGPLRAMSGNLVGREGGRARWTSYEKRMPVKNVIGRTIGWTRTETSLPLPAMITRHATHLECLLYVSFDLPQSRDPSRARPIVFESVLFTLSRRTLTRSGREERPQFLIDELRREEVALTDAAGGRLRLSPGEGRDLRLSFDLQSQGFVMVNGGAKELVPLRAAGLSLRTPNVEREYIVSATISPVGAPPFYLFRCPLQVIAGDYDEVPAFEAAAGRTPAGGATRVDEPPAYFFA